MKNFLIASAALLAGTAAMAQTAPVAPAAPPPPMAHPMADATMTRDEVVAMVRDHFGRMDADKNGSITTDEVMKGHDKMAGHIRDMRIEHGDGDKYGEPHVMRLERRDPKEAFERLDSNKDGAISFDEFSKGREERIEQRIEIREGRKDAGKDGQWRGKHAMRMHHGGMMGGRMIVMADSDHDGKITLAEAQTMALQHFDQMDANHDGKVTPDERRAGRPIIIKQVIEKKKTAS
jgi:Ca2+-binding EF-hand superfamily protein